MRAEDITLGQLRAMSSSNTPILISLDWLFAPDHASRVAIVNRALDIACADLVGSRHLKQKHGEDALTVELVAALKYMNMDATHDSSVGGHPDIVVRSRDDFLWVGEAKKHSSYDKLLDGFDQLATRYSTGLAGQQDGGFIVYCFVEDAQNVFDRWLTHLQNERLDVSIASGAGHIRESEHKHVGAGTIFRTTHRIVPMLWKPAPKN